MGHKAIFISVKAIARRRVTCDQSAVTRAIFLLCAPALGAIVAGCTTPGAVDLSRAEADPWERSNRRVYAFNKGLDRWVVKPVARVYRTAVPKPGRTAIANVYGNYAEPANFVNAVLQGKFAQAFRTVDRFVLNATLGVGGITDVATDLGRPREPEDFGQTLARWGVKSGPYMVLPLFGPSTLRDGLMTPVDFVVDPADFTRNAWLRPGWDVRIGVAVGRIVNFRNGLIEAGADQLLAGSLDEYALTRSAYLQRRRLQLSDGQQTPDDDPFADPVDEPADNPAQVPPDKPSPPNP